MDKKKLLFLTVGLALLLIVATVLYRQLGSQVDTDNLGTQEPQGQEQQEAGQQTPQKVLAPDFTVVDADGREVKLSDFRGKPTVVNFWATWCGYCKQEMPTFEEVYQQYGDDINFLMIDIADGTQETVEKASAYIADNGYTFPVYYDTQLDATMTYGAYSLPVTYFFDAEGYGIAQGRGALDKDALLRGISMIIE